MTFLAWDPSYATGIRIIDDEHQHLFTLINKLAATRGGTASHETVQEVVLGLRDYVRTHFVVEEELMRVYKYPGYEAHKKLHKEFFDKVEQLYQDTLSGELIVMNFLVDFIKNWLVEHVLKVDMDYVGFIPKDGINEQIPRS